MVRRFRTCVVTFKMIKRGLCGMLLLGIFIYPVHAASPEHVLATPTDHQQGHISYQALNPLSFYVPTGKGMTDRHHNIAGPR